MKTTIYLIRHSEKINSQLLNNENNKEYYQVRREKIVLSVRGEKKAEALSMQNELQNLDIIFSSNYSRAIQTAKYFAESQNIIINIDGRFNERKVGIIPNDNGQIDFKQYYDENIRNPEGESRKEVADRMEEGFWDVINNNKGKRIAVFTHAAAMTFLLMRWCNLKYIDKDKKTCLEFKNKIIFNKIFDAPEVFKLIIEDNEILSIENMEFLYRIK